MKEPSAPGLHSRRNALGLGAMPSVGLASAGTFLSSDVAKAAPVETNAPVSAGPLRSAGAMAFGPADVPRHDIRPGKTVGQSPALVEVSDVRDVAKSIVEETAL
jgi:hypothetical protein